MTKEFLHKGILINKLITAYVYEVDSLKKLRQNIASSRFFEIVEGNTKNNKIKEINSKIITLENIINEDIDKLIDVKNEIRKFINNINDEELLSILSLKYISFNTFEQIAEILHFSERQIYRLHKKAIFELEKHKDKIPHIVDNKIKLDHYA